MCVIFMAVALGDQQEAWQGASDAAFHVKEYLTLVFVLSILLDLDVREGSLLLMVSSGVTALHAQLHAELQTLPIYGNHSFLLRGKAWLMLILVPLSCTAVARACHT